MNIEDDLALTAMTEAARALLATLAAEGIDIPETRALALACTATKSHGLRHSDTSED